MPATINELRVEVTANTLGKMQYFPYFECIDIVLDQCPDNKKLIKGSPFTHSNICRATSALYFSFLKSKASPEVKKKKTRKGVRCGGCAIPMDNVFLGE